VTGGPLVFLDVDGTLLPFATVTGSASGNPLLAQVDRELARRLTGLPVQLVWATTWMDEANDVLAPVLGWPPLPVLDAADRSVADEYFGLHWKTRPILARAAGEAFAWLDDELTVADREWTREHHPGPALLLSVNPRTGLTSTDLDRLESWVGDQR
jgi:hypothetical protein